MKKTSQRATTFVQLLARIVLFLAFVPTGWHHAMHIGNFSGEAGARLRELGIVSMQGWTDHGTGMQHGMQQMQHGTGMQRASADSPTEDGTGMPRTDALVFVRVARQGGEAPSIPTDAANAMDLNTRSLHELTLVFDTHGLPRPEIWAWTVTAFELFGGSLILLGLFTRLWAMGLTVWAIALLLLNTPSGAIAWDSIWQTTDPNLAAVRTLVLMQLSLIVLAASLLLTGAGKLSLDGVIFGGGGKGGGKGGEKE